MTGVAPVRVFVSPYGNGFMRDIAEWLVEAAELSGRTAELVLDRLPRVDGSINLVVAPHELFELADASQDDLKRAAAASVCVCTEQPGTPWFHLSVDACRRGITTLDINRHGVDALRSVGVDAHHLPLGAVPSMSAPGWSVGDRPIDVLVMAGLDDRRGALLAQFAPRLYRRHVELRLFRFDRPVSGRTPGVVFGADKYRLLRSAKVLLNLHRDRSMHLAPGADAPPYFEWARMIETMANGCVVVSEPSEGFDPLVAGEHFVEASGDALVDALDELIDQPGRRDQLATSAYSMVTETLSLRRSLADHLDRIERQVLPRLAEHVQSSRPERGQWRLGASKVPPPKRLGPFRPYLDLQRAAKRLALAENDALRRLDAAACLLEHGSRQHVVQMTTPAWDAARPEVSVVVSLYNYADVVRETLDSIVASEEIAFEVVVVDDHATDHSRQVVEQYLSEHPDVAMLVVEKDANEGLAAARNTGFAAARAELVMVMDADNHLYPTALRRLADALVAHPDAAAAYSALEDFGAARGVRSAVAWDPERLCVANYIDAQALWRRSAWQRLGGYRCDDDHVFGWEDWDLWLRLADDGGHAVSVPQILGRYRVQVGSMIALTNLATDEAIDAIRRRYPRLPWPANP
jgi:hypothetical protein